MYLLLLIIIIILLLIRWFSKKYESLHLLELQEINRYSVDHADQGVAVDYQYVYPISNQQVSKYDKLTGKKIDQWIGNVEHLNGGIIKNNKLFLTENTSNQIIILDPNTMKTFGKINISINGSLNWIDYYQNTWWGINAHYRKNLDQTRLINFDQNWKSVQEWKLPNTVLERLKPFSISGGAFGPQGYLYLTGHDKKEIYVLGVPTEGNELQLIKILETTFPGQGISWDGNNLWSTNRNLKKIIVSELI